MFLKIEFCTQIKDYLKNHLPSAIWKMKLRENKNMFLFSFLSALVEMDVFVDISVDFMLVGKSFGVKSLVYIL